MGEYLCHALKGIVLPLLARNDADMILVQEARFLVTIELAIRLQLRLQLLLALPGPVNLLLAQFAVRQHHRHLGLAHQLHRVIEVLAHGAHPLRRYDAVEAAGRLAVGEGAVVVDEGEARHLRVLALVRLKLHQQVADVTVGIAADEVQRLHRRNVVIGRRTLKILRRVFRLWIAGLEPVDIQAVRRRHERAGHADAVLDHRHRLCLGDQIGLAEHAGHAVHRHVALVDVGALLDVNGPVFSNILSVEMRNGLHILLQVLEKGKEVLVIFRRLQRLLSDGVAEDQLIDSGLHSGAQCLRRFARLRPLVTVEIVVPGAK